MDNKKTGEKIMNKGKITIILESIILILSIYSLTGLAKAETKIPQQIISIEESFNATKANFTSYYLTQDTILSKMNFAKKRGLINELISALQIDNGSFIIKDGKGLYHSEGKWGESIVSLNLIENIDQAQNSYLTIKISNHSSLNTFKKDYQRLANTLQKVKVKENINSCIQGRIYDKLQDSEQLKLLNLILHKYEGEVVEQLNTPLLNSFSIYSKKWTNYIYTGNKQMNLQIAIHIDQKKQETAFTIGTPIILIEY